MTWPSGGDGSQKSLRPRPRLFVALCAIFAMWMAALLILYFISVYPRRHPPNCGVQIPSVLDK